MPNSSLSRFSKTMVSLALVVGIILLAAADYLTGTELAFSVFYLFPVGLAAWYVNRAAGVALSVLGALAWYLADSLGRTVPYSSAFVPAWNTGVRLATFFIVAILLDTLKGALQRESHHARIDPGTEAANARAFYEAAEVEIAKLKRFARPFTILYLDVDNLKKLNDTRGHSEGDKVLSASVATLKRSVRAGDTVARLGGDEFAVLLAEADASAARVASERVQSALRQSLGRQMGVTFSIGVLTCSAPPHSVDELTKWADNLMYEAKRAGKDRSQLAVYDGAG